MRVLLALAFAGLAGGCSKDQQPAASEPERPSNTVLIRDPLIGGPYPTLLLSKAHFDYRLNDQGRRVPVPGNARLVLVRKTERGWQKVRLEDSDSNVFHKAMTFDLDGKGPGILTIAGTRAALKVWRWRDGAWTTETLWEPRFGGKWDRLRDVEIGDVTGDAKPEIVLATHDQGVVAVLSQSASGWTPRELDRSPRTFVHEVEIGDIDGDGLNEIFATPSQPNQASLASQPGRIVMYRWNGSGFDRQLVDAPEGTHAKEILAVDLDGNGRATLLAAVEARTEQRGASLVTLQPVQIRAYEFHGTQVSWRVIATLNDRQCRFLSPGDVDGDGRIDVVATGMTSGVWLLRRQDDGSWAQSLIDAASSGFEHATLAADVEGDGRFDVYVASDEQGQLRRYRWQGNRFVREVITNLPSDEITFHIAQGRF